MERRQAMPTDNDRREVARKMRSFVTDDSVYADVDACRVLHSIGLYYKDIDRIYFSGFDVARLADLIEPSCDRDALLAPAEEMVEAFRLGAFTGEGLDAKWCRELHDKYADRIREALGAKS